MVKSGKMSGKHVQHYLQSLDYLLNCGCPWRKSLSCVLDCAPVWPWRISGSRWALKVGQHICNATAAVGSCEVSGAHASPRTGHAVALKAKLNPGRQLWPGVRRLQGRCCAGSLVLGGRMEQGVWKELISCSLRSTRGHAQSCAVWEFAMLAQLLTVWAGFLGLHFTEAVRKWKWGSLFLAQFALQNHRYFSFPFCERGVFSFLFLFCLVCPLNGMLTLLTCVSAKCVKPKRSWKQEC